MGLSMSLLSINKLIQQNKRSGTTYRATTLAQLITTTQAVTATFIMKSSSQTATGSNSKALHLTAYGEGTLLPITISATPTGLPSGAKLPMDQLRYTITGTLPGGLCRSASSSIAASI